METQKKIGFYSATAMVVSNMIGTGVFTSLGFQLMGIKSVFAIMILWFIGGIAALCGAFCYSELASRFPKSGGEYNFLSSIYSPAFGFLSGFVSISVGFAVPVAISAMAFQKYFITIAPFAQGKLIAIFAVIFIVGLNFLKIELSGLFQRIITIATILLIFFIVICGFWQGPHSGFSFTVNSNDIQNVFSFPFGVSLVYVSYAYSGWNSAAYIAGEIKDPQKNLSRALVIGTAIVTLFYILLNFIFLYTSPIEALNGQLEVGFIASRNIFGESGAKFISGIICVALLGSMFSMTLAGPQVTRRLGEDYPLYNFLSRLNKSGIPYVALLIQCCITLFIVWTSAFENVMLYIGLTLSLMTTSSVFGLFVLETKKKRPKAFKFQIFMLLAILFIIMETWMIIFTLIERPVTSIIGFTTFYVGLIFYYIAKKHRKKHA